MPSSPGSRPVIMQLQAGTVIGGSTLRSGPHVPRSTRPREVRQVVEPAVEDERRLGAVEADDRDPRAHGFLARVRARRACVSPSWRILAVRTTRTVRVRAARRSARGSRTRTVRVPGATLRRV